MPDLDWTDEFNTRTGTEEHRATLGRYALGVFHQMDSYDTEWEVREGDCLIASGTVRLPYCCTPQNYSIPVSTAMMVAVTVAATYTSDIVGRNRRFGQLGATLRTVGGFEATWPADDEWDA